MRSWRTSAAVVLIALLAGFQEVKAQSLPKKGAGPEHMWLRASPTQTL